MRMPCVKMVFVLGISLVMYTNSLITQSNPQLFRYPPLLEKGISHSGAYASGFENIQSGFPAGVTTALNFTENRVSPKRISHPVRGDVTKFKIKKRGKYLISWTMSINNQTNNEVIQISLLNVTKSTSTPLEEATISIGESIIASGSAIFHFASDTVLQLTITPTQSGTNIIGGATFNIVRID